MGEKNDGRANLIKQRRLTSCQGIQKVYKKNMYTLCTVHPGVQACTHFHLTPSMYTLCTPKKDESVEKTDYSPIISINYWFSFPSRGSIC